MKTIVKISLIGLLSLGIAFGGYVLTSVDEGIIDYANERINEITAESPEKDAILRDKIEVVATGKFSERIKAVFSKILERWNTPAIVDGMFELDSSDPDRMKKCREIGGKLSPMSEFGCMAPLDDFGNSCIDGDDCEGYCATRRIDSNSDVLQISETGTCSMHIYSSCMDRFEDGKSTGMLCVGG